MKELLTFKSIHVDLMEPDDDEERTYAINVQVSFDPSTLGPDVDRDMVDAASGAGIRYQARIIPSSRSGYYQVAVEDSSNWTPSSEDIGIEEKSRYEALAQLLVSIVRDVTMSLDSAAS